ncbi:MAG: Ldh family oxidoreductase [Hyphomicrobiales bacterium]|nr:Ldh family oxidoreductase [Hyphomicrobiales bacterium]
MGETDVVVVPVDTLRDFLTRIFAAAGCDAENARLNAVGVVEADLHGHHIQGTDHIYSTIRELRAGHLNGHARPTIVRETAATAQVDGDGGTGHVTGLYAAELAIRKAREAGLAAVGLVGGGDIFMLGYYAETVARAGLVGMVFTNTHPVRVHPAGGIDPLLGTNPVAFAFPVAGQDPIVIDLATSTSAIGHVRIASYSGAPIPAGVAIDRDGRPTTDAKTALEGALTPLGGHKGFALGFAVALLSGPVVGAAIGRELGQAIAHGLGERRRGHLFLALDPAAFGDAAVSARRTAAYIAELKASRKAPGVDAIRIPGERGQRMKRHAQEHGIALLTTIWANTLKIAADLGVPAPALR